MFSNIGGKIKGLAAFMCWVGIIISILGGLALFMIGEIFAIIIGIVIAVVGSLFSWIGSFLLYGFGQLIYNSDIVAKNTNSSNHNPVPYLQNIQPYPAQQMPYMPVAPVMQGAPVANPMPTEHQWRCDNCGNMISKEICPNCGKPHGKAVERVATLQALFKDGIITEEEYNLKLEKLKNE